MKTFDEFVDIKNARVFAETLVIQGVDVPAFCEWYYEQRLANRPLNEGGVTDWFKKIGAGFRGALGGARQNFRYGALGQDHRNAIDNAIKSLNQLQQKLPDLVRDGQFAQPFQSLMQLLNREAQGEKIPYAQSVRGGPGGGPGGGGPGGGGPGGGGPGGGGPGGGGPGGGGPGGGGPGGHIPSWGTPSANPITPPGSGPNAPRQPLPPSDTPHAPTGWTPGGWGGTGGNQLPRGPGEPGGPQPSGPKPHVPGWDMYK